jgi:hypothetical protein
LLLVSFSRVHTRPYLCVLLFVNLSAPSTIDDDDDDGGGGGGNNGGQYQRRRL